MGKITFAGCLLLQGALLQAAEVKPHNPEAIDRAMKSIHAAAEKVAQDPARPGYHLLPPGNWMNDPNGLLFHDGWYHMFYQHNPYGDGWGHMHWGHLRSRDLVHWEHLPVALWPSEEAAEEHVFSGCATVNDLDQPMLFYTSIKRGKSAGEFAEQWAAIPQDEELIRWEKHPDNPVLIEEIHGDVKVWDWRDPFIFQYQGDDYMVLGGNLNRGKGGQAVVTLYKARNKALTEWEYKGILFTHPDPEVGNIECPNFFELNGRWVLIISPHRKVEYFVGSFDGEKFTSKSRGLVDHSDNFYAPNSMVDAKGRRLLWGWIRGFKDGQGWNGCLTLPRRLEVDNQGRLWQMPPSELGGLRGRKLHELKKSLSRGEKVFLENDASQIEITARFVSGNNNGLRLYADGKGGGLQLFYRDGKLTVGDQTLDFVLAVNDSLLLQVFVDHSVVELFANGRLCHSFVHYAEGNPNVEAFTEDENTQLHLSITELKSIWPE